MRRRFTFVAVLVAVLLAVYAFSAATPKTYRSTVKLIAGNPAPIQEVATAGRQETPQTTLPVLNALLTGGVARSSETYAELFREEPVARAVIANLGLQMTPGDLLAHVKVEPVFGTNVLAVSVGWSDPVTSAKVANEVAKAFVERERGLVSSQADQTIQSLGRQLPAVQGDVRGAAAAVVRFEREHHIVDVDAQTRGLVQEAAALDQQIDQAQLERLQAQAQVESIVRQLGTVASTVGETSSAVRPPVLLQLDQQLAEAQVALHEAQQKFTDQHPTVIALQERIAAIAERIKAEPQTIAGVTSTKANPVYDQIARELTDARLRETGAAARFAPLLQQRAALDRRFGALPATTAQLATLQRREREAEAIYAAMEQKYNEALIAKATALSDVIITEPATPENAAVRPNVRLNLELGLIVGLVLAVTAVLAMDFFDDSIAEESEIASELHLPVLASIPLLPVHVGQGKKSRRVAYLTVEAFLHLVTSIRYSSPTPLRTITVTSPRKGDGKSTVAINAAKAFGELSAPHVGPNGHAAAAPEPQSADRVLLIDADMRTPSIDRTLAVPPSPGLSDVVIGGLPLDQATRSTGFPGLDVLTAGTPAPNPVKLLESAAFDRLLHEARRRYAVVVIDAPAMTAATDAAVLSTKSDGTILVVSAGRTQMRGTKRALERLQQVGARDILGVVVNRITVSPTFRLPEAAAGEQTAALPTS